MGVNKFYGIGNLGKDPEIKELSNDNKLASFSVGISETYKDKQGEKKTVTEWVNCTVFGKLAGIVEQYLKKGSKVYIEGKLKTDSYEKDGEKRYSTKVIVNSLEMLGGKPEQKQVENNPSGDTDNLPF